MGFVVRFDFDPGAGGNQWGNQDGGGLAKCFVQILGEDMFEEAKNYKYTIKLEDPEFGYRYFQNQVNSEDENICEEAYNWGLILPLLMFRKYIGKDLPCPFEVEIED